jgi:predicted 2-oxoglutarate/Fe(II)-dependent dioxygenase YbiX
MKIQVIPKVLSQELIDKLMQDINPKVNATAMTYFSNSNGNNPGVKKIKCTDHEIVKHISNCSEYVTESVSIVYYPTGSYNTPHADNCIIDNGVVTRVKDWTHSGIIFLNNNFTGGELIYPEQGCVFLPTVGTMVITPAGEDYVHYVNPVLSGERFTLVFRFI